MNERGEPPVGGLGEEAVRLLQALQDWARDATDDAVGPAGSLLSRLDEHVATGGRDCRYCPVCQLLAAVRATSPEVKHHLSVAASSLFQAAAGLMAPPQASRPPEDRVERIDLDDDHWEED